MNAKSWLLCRFLMLLLTALLLSSHVAQADDELIFCGADEVFALRVSGPDKISTNKVWSWRGSDCPKLPGRLQDKLGTTDECKSVDGGKKVLITSSGGRSMRGRVAVLCGSWIVGVNARRGTLTPTHPRHPQPKHHLLRLLTT